MRHLKRTVAAGMAVLLMVQATGCTSWRVAQPLPTAVAENPHRNVQVALLDGRLITADSARASADALVTYRIGKVDTIPLAQIKGAKVRQPNILKTAGLLLGLAAGAVAALVGIYAVDCANSDC